ncbi:class I SAM-dependent methyltransferase [Nocardioides limicola]|uniref:class I SAM-dependent methyltransferase n=1 Tax=Nocardioides limicola TaxID=2803368 RepID=UPI00193C83CB|nr:class I SAM-dependent methyltransferase [Nocardioides sp. DJM-14]
MNEEFDRDFWERHWHSDDNEAVHSNPAHPYLARKTRGLTPGTALDAGCGTGAEAIWLAEQGWQVTGVDISPAALRQAGVRADSAAVSVRWVEADLTTWQPGTTFDLVSTHYAHSSLPPGEFYDRIGSWVAPGGTLLIVGHRHPHDAPEGPGDHPPAEAESSAAAVAAQLARGGWTVDTVEEHRRTLADADGHPHVLHDFVVLARRG